MYNTYLSIGTVVLLKGEGKKVMVIGYFGRDVDGKMVDYMAVTYPEGYMDAESIIGFNRAEVLQVLHEGYKDVEQERFYTELNAFSEGLVVGNTKTVPFVNTPTQPVQQTIQQPTNQDNDNIDTI